MPNIGGINNIDLGNLRSMFKGVRLLKPILNMVLSYESKLVRD
jgi:hypothetical protein